MNNKEIDEYLKEKIKDKKARDTIKKLIDNKKSVVSLDSEDLKSVLDNSKETEFISGYENDLPPKIKNPEGIKGAAIWMECPEDAKLEKDVRPAVSKITEKMSKDARIVWGAGVSKKVKKIRFYAVFGY